MYDVKTKDPAVIIMTTSPDISENNCSLDLEQFNCERCLVCYGYSRTTASSSENIWSPSPISGRLHVIFILRKLLELPNDILEKYLTCLGDPFEKWVTLCSNCSAIIDQAEKVYYELVKIQRKFDSLRKIIIDKVKNSEEINGGNEEVRKRRRGLRKKESHYQLESLVTSANLTDACRAFIKSNDYKLLLDPFNSGNEVLEPPLKSSLRLPEVEGEVTYLYLPREEYGYNDHSNSNLNQNDNDNGGHMDSEDLGDPSSDIEMNYNDVDGELSSSSSSSCPSKSKPKKNKTLGSLKRLEAAEKKAESKIDWSVQLECPFCESYRFPIIRGEQFCSHLDNCIGLLEEKKDKRLCCPICENFSRTPKERIEFAEHLPICYGRSQNSKESLNWKVLTCDACPGDGPGMKYFKLDGFMQHYQYHKKNLFRCTLCSTRVLNRENGRIHLEGSHPDSLETIDVESCIVEDKSLPSLPLWCPLCPGTHFIEESLRDSHIESEHPDFKYSTVESNLKCRFCSKSYSCPYDTQLHEWMEHDHRRFSCYICSDSFRQKASCQEHMELIHGYMEKLTDHFQFSCTLCADSFACRSRLQEHIRKKHGQKYETSFSCKMCGFHCQSNAHLRRHLGQKHGIGDYDKHVCPHEGCGRVFWFKLCLKRHLAMHAGQPEFRCSFCYKGLYTKTGLEVHELTHTNPETGTRSYQCQKCGKTFRTSRNLTSHMGYHRKKEMGEPRWTCPCCFKTFSNKKNGKRHFAEFCKGNRESKSDTNTNVHLTESDLPS